MQNLVISLKTATARRAHIQKQFDQQSIPFTFFDALTPDLALPLAQHMQFNIEDEFLSSRELACFMSHVSIWQKIVDENIPYMAIFEDDVYLGEHITELLNSAAWLEGKDWQIIKIEAFDQKVFLSSTSTPVGSGERKIYQLKGRNLGAAGYILSLQGAQAYLEYLKTSPAIALDEIMFDVYLKNGQLKVYQIEPALCIQEMLLYPEKCQTGLVSDLVDERKQRMKKYKKQGLAKVQHEIMRILKQIYKQLFAKAVQFK